LSLVKYHDAQNILLLRDWKRVINILRYLNYTKNYKITYKGQGEIVAYCYSDFAGDPKDSKSTSGYIILMNNDPICWQSKKKKKKKKKQSIVATSTAEAEYIAMSECVKKKKGSKCKKYFA